MIIAEGVFSFEVVGSDVFLGISYGYVLSESKCGK